MRYIEGINRSQIVLFPEKLDDLVSGDNPVRFIDAFINQLDLQRIGFTNTSLDKTSPGASRYSPECLLNVWN